jgi:putative transposase
MMTQLNFTLDVDLLKDSVLNSNLEAVVKSTIVLVLNEYMEKERDEYLQTASYERSLERIDYRNGYYERDLLLSIGKVNLRVPRTREGNFSPSVFEEFSRVDQSFILAMIEMVVNGVSTRKVTNVVHQLTGEHVSKSFVSSLTQKLDPIVNEWAQRPLNVMYFPYVYVDAMYIKVREDNKVVSKAVYIATAINDKNDREIIGLKVEHVESYAAWKSFFQYLKSRGLQSPKLIISDAHSGLIKAIQHEFIGTSWQRCTVHFKRNFIARLPKKGVKAIVADMRKIYNCISIDHARETKDEFVLKYAEDPKVKRAIELLEEAFDDTIQYLHQPEKYHRFLSSTNWLERINQEVRRREIVIRIFPNTQSAFRLVAAVLMDVDSRQRARKKAGL